MAKKYYNIKPILAIDAQWNIMLSERSNGKSYACKQLVIDAALDNPAKIVGIVLRREVQETVSTVVGDYFNDLASYLEKKSKGKYNAFSFYQGQWYIGHFDENYKIIKDFPFCKVCALAHAHIYKSNLVVPDLIYIIYEEFMSKNPYLEHEPDKLQDFVSTCARHEIVKVLLIANKVNRVCPYVNEWGLRGIPKMKEGQIDTYIIHTNINGIERDVKIAFELCPVMEEAAKSGMFFGKAAESIAGGTWETNLHPHIIGDLSDYDIIYEMSLEHMEFRFNMLLILHKKEDFIAVFVYPVKVKMYDRLITEEYSPDPFKIPFFRRDIRPEVLMVDLYNKNKWVYPNNLIGDDFIHTLENMKEFPIQLK